MSAINSVQVVPLISKVSSGPSLSVPTLCQALVDAGVDTHLMALDPRPERLIFKDTTFFPYSRLPWAKPLGVSPAMKAALAKAAQSADIMHTHSLWKMPNVYPEQACRGTDCKLLISPRGTLSEWAWKRSRMRKRLVWSGGQKRTVMRADCFHATSTEELRQVRRFRPDVPVAVIPNGVHCPDLTAYKKSSNRDHRVVLFLARIHPTKGVDLLLEAWSRLGSVANDWELQIAGPNDHAFATEMMKRRDSLGLRNVDFIGEVIGEEKSRSFVNADVYVLPSHTENFGISVAEALAHALPAIVFEGAPWSGLNDREAGWWIPQSTESLVDALQVAMDLSDTRRAEMGQNGRSWVKETFDWNVVGHITADVYRWLVHGGSLPAEMFLD